MATHMVQPRAQSTRLAGRAHFFDGRSVQWRGHFNVLQKGWLSVLTPDEIESFMVYVLAWKKISRPQ
jgi:hypothetical protein